MGSTKRQKFRQTKKLIEIARNSGLSQGQIAKMCRTQQSVVSAWANGEKKAFQDQVISLLELCGDRLRLATVSTYCTVEYYFEVSSILATRLEALGLDITKLEKLNKISKYDLRELLTSSTGTNFSAITKDIPLTYDETIVQVEAPVIFRYTFQLQHIVRNAIKKYSFGRWIIHNLGNGNLLLVIQRRRSLVGSQLEKEFETLDKIIKTLHNQLESNTRFSSDFSVPANPHFVDTCNDDAARWESYIQEKMTAEELLDMTRNYLVNPETLHTGHDEAALPFLLKKALLEAGLPIGGVEKITTSY